MNKYYRCEYCKNEYVNFQKYCEGCGASSFKEISARSEYMQHGLTTTYYGTTGMRIDWEKYKRKM